MRHRIAIVTLSFLVLLCSSVVRAEEGQTEGQPTVCSASPEGWLYNEDTGHWYKRTLNAASWSASQAQAESWCGYLATLNSQAEISWLNASGLLNDTWEVWIGLTDAAEEGTPAWANGEPVTVLNWDSGEPNSFRLDEDYVAIYGSDGPRRLGSWNDFKEYGPWFGIVERETDPAQDTSVDVPLTEVGDCSETDGWKFNPTTGHWYRRTLIATDRDQAVDVASSWCGYLLEVNDSSENRWVASESGLLTDVYHAWIGLTDLEVENTFAWDSGTLSNYRNWSSREPNDFGSGEDYVMMVGPDSRRTLGSWMDYDTYGPWYAIIERDTEPGAEGEEGEGAQEGEGEGEGQPATGNTCLLSPVPVLLFPLLDADDNDEVSRAELQLLAFHARFLRCNLDSLFDLADGDDSGGVSREEALNYLLACHHYFHGEAESSENDLEVTVQHRVQGNGFYYPNREVIVETTLDSLSDGEGFTGLALTETLPEGWRVTRVLESAGASTLPAPGDGGAVMFEWNNLPVLPVKVRYGVRPRFFNGPQVILGQAQFTLGKGDTLEGPLSALALGAGSRDDFCHSADVNRDWTLSLSELLRVIQFYTLLEIECASDTEDGYRPAAWGEQVTCLAHNGDTNSDWSFSLNELLRMIQHYNSDNSAYHLATGEATEDGFVPGPFVLE